MDFEEIDMLDLFAGTGGIGLECISRGAREVTAVELAHVQQNWIIACCKQLGIRNLSVIRGDVFKFLSSCRAKYDLIFADPPYALAELPALPDMILKPLAVSHQNSEETDSILKPGGWLVIEHGKDTDVTSIRDLWKPVLTEVYMSVSSNTKRGERLFFYYSYQEPKVLGY